MSNSKAEGRREDALVKQRERMRSDFERQKQNLINETEKARPSVQRFVGQNASIEEVLKHSTVGLVHLEDFQQKKKELQEAKAREAARNNQPQYAPSAAGSQTLSASSQEPLSPGTVASLSSTDVVGLRAEVENLRRVMQEIRQERMEAPPEYGV